MDCNITFSVNCGVPRHPGNGTIVNYTSTVEGSVLLYQCNPGFSPVGVMTAMCSTDGRWIPDVTCRKIGLYMTMNRGKKRELINEFASFISVDCGPPLAPWNGSLESYSGTTEGSEVFYSCNPGLVPEGRMRAVCNRNGWSPNPANLHCILGNFQQICMIDDGTCLMCSDL